MKVFLIVLFFLYSWTTEACPFCSTKTAGEIRTSLFGPDIFFNIGATLLPFVIFFCVAVFIYYGSSFEGNKKFHQK
jgi:hypothetical protein